MKTKRTIFSGYKIKEAVIVGVITWAITSILGRAIEYITRPLRKNSNEYLAFIGKSLNFKFQIQAYWFLIALLVFFMVKYGLRKLVVRRRKLKIISAVYGANNAYLDITNKLNDSVVDNSLKILLSNNIAGDPIYGVPKHGKIKYSFGGKIHKGAYAEGDVINIP